MPKTSELFAETTENLVSPGVIDDALASMRITGSLLLRESYCTPWAVTVPGSVGLAKLLDTPKGVRAVAFHLVEFGQCEIVADGAERLLLNAGDMAVCFGGSPHRLSAGARARPQPIASLIAGGKNLHAASNNPRAASTSLICGVFLLRHAELNPLLAALPLIVRTGLGGRGALHGLPVIAGLLSDEIQRASHGSRFVMERLVELLCAEVVRTHLQTEEHSVGWFRGIKDPVIGRAIAALHAQPGADWSVHRLALEVSLSPSRFAARFSESVGYSPMAYLTRWRMYLACRTLAGSNVAIDQIAADAGYEGTAAFTRAFKKLVGQPPAAWRALQ